MVKFKPHIMYSKAGKPVKAATYAKHLELKKKGYGHSKPKKKRWKTLSVLDVKGDIHIVAAYVLNFSFIASMFNKPNNPHNPTPYAAISR